MKIRRTIAAGTLALTTVITAGPLAAGASAQTGTSSPPVAQNTNCRRIVKQVRNVTRRLGRAQARLAFWQKVAAEMPARIETQQATVADLQAQLAAATGDAATALQAQLDNATEKLAWMQAKLAASGRRIPVWTDAVARLTALQTTLTEQATTGECPLPTTTTVPATEAGDDSSSSSTSSTVPGDDKGGERSEVEDEDEGDDSPSSTVEDRTAAERVAEAQRKAAERTAEAQKRAAEAQRKAAERAAEAQKRAAEAQRKAAEAQRRAAESGRRNRGGQSSTTSPAPTVDDRGGSSGRDGVDD